MRILATVMMYFVTLSATIRIAAAFNPQTFEGQTACGAAALIIPILVAVIVWIKSP